MKNLFFIINLVFAFNLVSAHDCDLTALEKEIIKCYNLNEIDAKTLVHSTDSHLKMMTETRIAPDKGIYKLGSLTEEKARLLGLGYAHHDVVNYLLAVNNTLQLSSGFKAPIKDKNCTGEKLPTDPPPIGTDESFDVTQSITWAKNKNAQLTGSLKIMELSSLHFGVATPGDPAKKIEVRNGAPDAGSASFSILGQPNTSYAVSFPEDAIQLSTGDGVGPLKEINVTSFEVNKDHLYLDAAGEDFIYIGATREEISSAQIYGAYSGTAVIRVTYQ